MSSLLDTSWFYWAIGVAIGLPVALVLLTELHHSLARRGSYLARLGTGWRSVRIAAE